MGLDVNLADRRYFEEFRLGVSRPSTEELCAFLSKNFRLPARASLAGLTQRLRVEGYGFRDHLERIFTDQALEPSRLHRVLADITARVTASLPEKPIDRCHGSLLFITTTYDTSLEDAFVAAGIDAFHTLFYNQSNDGQWQFTHRRHEVIDGKAKVSEATNLAAPVNPNKYEGLHNNRPVILKLPGEVTLERSRYAIAEDDFFGFAFKSLSELLPADLLGQIRDSRHLYLGYDLQSWTVRLIWHRLCENHTKKHDSYAVVFDKDPNRSFWNQNRIDIVDAKLDDYIEGLETYLLAQVQ
jgi:hypothetical protein